MTRLAAAVRAALVVATLGFLLLGGCTRAPAVDPSPSPSPTAAAPGTPVLAPDGTWRVVLAAGPVSLQVAAAAARLDDGSSPVEATPESDGVAALTVDPDGLSRDVPVVLTLDPPGSLEAAGDGGVSVLDAAGTVVGGIPAPGADVTLAVTDATHAALTVPEPADAAARATPVALTLGTHGLVSATWGDREGGRSLAVDPTRWARRSGAAGWALVWAEVVAAHPDAGTAGMHDQLVCHGIGAPDKATWNLEPWRPDVGLAAVLAARCNPT